MRQDMSIKECIDNILSDLQSVVEEKPYIAFYTLFVLVEFLGKCLNDLEWEDKNHSSSDFFQAIYTYPSLKDYKILEKGNYNDLFYVRCSLAHRMLADTEFRLDKDKNDLNQKIIGCKDFYADIQQAWKDAKEGNVNVKKNLDEIKMTTIDSLSGSTMTNKTIAKES